MTKVRGTVELTTGSLSSRGTGLFDGIFYGSVFYGWILKGKTPEKLRGSPPDPWPGDPECAATILKGEIPFEGGGIIIDDYLWTGRPVSGAVQDFLHGFAWLADLRSVENAAAKKLARDLTAGWMDHCARWRADVWRADVLGRRLGAWLATAGYLNDGASEEFRRRFLVSLAEQARHLERVCPGGGALGNEDPAAVFSAIKGLVYCGLCLPGFEAALERGLGLADREIARQVMADGTHFRRAPSMALAVLRHLTDIRGALDRARVECPAAIQNAIGRIAPMIRAMRLGDGGLATFDDSRPATFGSGGNGQDPRLIDVVLAQAAVRARPAAVLPDGGYHRLAAGHTIVIVDTGCPVISPPGSEERGGDGPTGFEMSAGKDRMVVHRGGGAGGGGGNRAPGKSKPERKEAGGSIWLDCDYGAGRRFHHRRRLYLDAAGEDLRGEDSLQGGAKNADFTIRFHLHPGVQASLVEDASAVLLKLSHGPGWRFHAKGGKIELSEDQFKIAGGRRRSEQITVSGPRTGNDVVKWAFRRSYKPTPGSGLGGG